MMDWQRYFPDLAAEADREIELAVAGAGMATLDEGAHVFHTGSACLNYLLVVAGDVRVQMVTESGRTATLYHVRDGNSCVLTTACLLGQTAYPAEAIVEKRTTALVMPKNVFDRAMDESAAMRRFVFANLGQRFSEVIARVEEIAFASIDRRLARTLLQRSRQDPVKATHEELATEAGTVREVISRHLKQFELRGWVRMQRGMIEIINREALGQLTGDSD